MNTEIQDFLTQNNIGVLCVTMDDGTPHAATIHYSHSEEPLTFYISTSAKSKKCEPLTNKSVAGSFVVGFSENEMKTFQADGMVSRVTDPDELASIYIIHYKKHPHAAAFKDNPNTAFLKFVPHWWRFSDLGATPPRVIAL